MRVGRSVGFRWCPQALQPPTPTLNPTLSSRESLASTLGWSHRAALHDSFPEKLTLRWKLECGRFIKELPEDRHPRREGTEAVGAGGEVELGCRPWESLSQPRETSAAMSLLSRNGTLGQEGISGLILDVRLERGVTLDSSSLG